MILKNAIIICEDAKSQIRLNSPNDCLIGNKIYSFTSNSIYNTDIYDERRKRSGFWSWFIHTIVRSLQNIANLLHGLESRYKVCCITAFLRSQSFNIDGIQQSLCYKCYKKMLKKDGEK